MVERPDSPYPYSPDKKIAVAANADWLDPLIALSYAAACTTSIRLATGILLLPQHHPLIIAKSAASLDVVSGGRFVLGVGVGWSKEEYAALGISFGDRIGRNREFVEAIRTLWRDDLSSYAGDFVDFGEVRSYPKPVANRTLPIILGGNSDAAFGARGPLRRRLVWLQPRCGRRGRAHRHLGGAMSRPRS